MRPAWMLLALFLGACAQAPVGAPPPDNEFDLAGRIAARYGEESFSGNLAWRHGRSRDELLISTALGQGIARIERDGESVTLTTAEPREYRAGDAEALTEQVLGFRLPLAGLADWVRGRPAAEFPALEDRGEDGRMRSIEQRGWKIEYLDYAQEPSSPLPSRLRLTYPGIELRLVISQWR